ncbi:MAG: hypothetical protein M3Y40_02425 [Chloroflexota bacterium]|nr:hypothetical protein [Chloroflexota bacterium]
MRRLAASVLASLILTPTRSTILAAQSASTALIMQGIAKEVDGGERPYATAGDRAYLIGSQHGGFPDMGDHVPGEMGGLWIHPIKLVDGFWATLRDPASGKSTDLSEAARIVAYPYGTRFRYEPVLDGLEIERFEFSPDGHPGVVIR